MRRVRLFHWRAAEAAPLIRQLRAAGYAVEYPGDKHNGSFRSLREGPFHAAVIDLTRLPSHGRWVAAEIRAHKALRSLPIVFVGGDPDKVAEIRQHMPDAIYTSPARLASALKKAKPLADPVQPPRMMARTDRTTAQKMGIREGARVAVIDPPRGYLQVIGAVPPGATLEEHPREILPITLWFIHDADTYLASLPRMRELTGARSRLWIVWPKAGTEKAATSGITQFLLRKAALEFGMVDYKICAVSPVWSAMLFTRKS
jgi:hypothetical protein